MNKRWPNGKTKKEYDMQVFIASHTNLIKPFTFYRKERSKMQKFWELLEKSTIFQGTITFCFVITTCYLWATGQIVPSQLWTADLIVIGFFFGSKSSQATEQIRKIGKR